MNNRLQIKVCGMRDEENINELVALRPDYIGFILFPGSKRYVGENFHLPDNFPTTIQRVGVFVDAPKDEVVKWIKILKLDFVQLHGFETPEYCREIDEQKIAIIKAFGVDEDFNFSVLEKYYPYCQYFLFDTKTTQHGGSGLQFNWEILKNYKHDKPIFLSGGIGPEDAENILKITDLPIEAIDINSKFEVSPALKNIQQLEKFIQKIRS